MAKKKSKEEEKEVEFGYSVTFDSRYDESREQHGEGAYNYSWSCTGFHRLQEVKKSKEYPDVTSPHDFKVGDPAYLVWAEWSDGDSFGSGNRNRVEAQGIFAIREEAEKYAHQLATTPRSEDYTYCKPWHGYFEHLDEMHVEGVVIF